MGERRIRRWWLVAGGLVVAAVLAFVLVWFQPQKLFIDERVDEELPVVSADEDRDDDDQVDDDGADDAATSGTSEPPGSTTSAPAGDGTVELATGEFISLDHGTTGLVRVVELADGTRIVRLEDLATDNGPDLFVYLSANPAAGPEGAFDDGFVNLGRLKGNLGNQNYELPPEVSLEDWASVVVWCDRFDSAFGAADLTAA